MDIFRDSHFSEILEIFQISFFHSFCANVGKFAQNLKNFRKKLNISMSSIKEEIVHRKMFGGSNLHQSELLVSKDLQSQRWKYQFFVFFGQILSNMVNLPKFAQKIPKK